MKHYLSQFKADSVALYPSRPEATIRQVAANLAINPRNPTELGPGGWRELAPGTPGGATRRAAHTADRPGVRHPGARPCIFGIRAAHDLGMMPDVLQPSVVVLPARQQHTEASKRSS